MRQKRIRNSIALRVYFLTNLISSHSLLWRHCFADGQCLFRQPQSVIYHWNQYDEEISKKCRSVRLPVCNANKKSLLLHY